VITNPCTSATTTIVDTVANGGITGPVAGVWSVRATYSFGVIPENCDDAPWTFTITVTDGLSTGSGSGAFNLVDDDATASASSVSATVTKSFTATVASFKAESGQTASSFTAAINWGDNTAASAGSVVSDGHGGFLVKGSHTYGNPGATSVVVTLSDNSGNSSKVTSPANVTKLNNPYSGTGSVNYAASGHSYPGSKYSLNLKYTDSTHISGTFGFTEYKSKFSTIQLSNTSFNSVVASGTTAYVLGTGSRGGSGGYTYLLTLVKSGFLSKVGLQVWAPGAVPVSDMSFNPRAISGTISIPSN